MLSVLHRDDQKVAEAALEARKNTKEGDEKALILLKESQAEIEEIVGHDCLLLSLDSPADHIVHYSGGAMGSPLRGRLW